MVACRRRVRPASAPGRAESRLKRSPPGDQTAKKRLCLPLRRSLGFEGGAAWSLAGGGFVPRPPREGLRAASGREPPAAKREPSKQSKRVKSNGLIDLQRRMPKV